MVSEASIPFLITGFCSPSTGWLFVLILGVGVPKSRYYFMLDLKGDNKKESCGDPAHALGEPLCAVKFQGVRREIMNTFVVTSPSP